MTTPVVRQVGFFVRSARVIPWSTSLPDGAFEFLHLIGRGSFGTVFACRNLREPDAPLLACKVVAKSSLYSEGDRAALRTEIKIMLHLGALPHAHVAAIHAVHEDERAVYVFMELCAGGDLFEYSIKNGPMPEEQAGRLFAQLVSAVAFCHRQGVVHRDLKPENVLLAPARRLCTCVARRSLPQQEDPPSKGPTHDQRREESPPVRAGAAPGDPLNNSPPSSSPSSSSSSFSSFASSCSSHSAASSAGGPSLPSSPSAPWVAPTAPPLPPNSHKHPLSSPGAMPVVALPAGAASSCCPAPQPPPPCACQRAPQQAEAGPAGDQLQTPPSANTVSPSPNPFPSSHPSSSSNPSPSARTSASPNPSLSPNSSPSSHPPPSSDPSSSPPSSSSPSPSFSSPPPPSRSSCLCCFDVKLADFGLAIHLPSGASACGDAGSAPYMAPEMLCGARYDASADVWSLGVLLHALLCGRWPFHSRCLRDLRRQVTAGHLDFSAAPWPSISADAKDLIRRMLTVRPAARLSSQQALQHPWVAARLAKRLVRTTKMMRLPLPSTMRQPSGQSADSADSAARGATARSPEGRGNGARQQHGTQLSSRQQQQQREGASGAGWAASAPLKGQAEAPSLASHIAAVARIAREAVAACMQQQAQQDHCQAQQQQQQCKQHQQCKQQAQEEAALEPVQSTAAVPAKTAGGGAELLPLAGAWLAALLALAAEAGRERHAAGSAGGAVRPHAHRDEGGSLAVGGRCRMVSCRRHAMHCLGACHF